jgi:hypothetical protein
MKISAPDTFVDKKLKGDLMITLWPIRDTHLGPGIFFILSGSFFEDFPP